MAQGNAQFILSVVGAPLAMLSLLAFPYAVAANDPVTQLSWLAGCWHAEGRQPGSGEH
jgi:hypothetical protein